MQIEADVRASKIHGKGAFAARAFGPGELIGIYEGTITTDLNHPRTLWLFDDHDVAFGIAGTGALSYMNHSEEPNATAFEGGPYVYARHAIKKGDELTISYGDDWAPEDEETEDDGS